MNKINRIISTQEKVGNTLFKYEVIDDQKNLQVVSSVQKYELGEEVLVIWSKLSDQYNTPYLKKKATIPSKQVTAFRRFFKNGEKYV